MRSIRPFALATGLLLAAAASTSAAEPALRRVLLSTGGVGYFGYEATPDAEGRLWLTVPLAQVDDILKSLTVLGARRCGALGQPAGADAPGRPVSRRALRRGRPGRPAEPARPPARGGGPGRGPGQPARPDPDAWRARRSSKGESRSARHRLSLAGPDGIRSVILETVDGLSFADAELQREMDQVLARLAEGGSAQERKLEIRLAGAPAGPVGLGYLAEMPLWKASWRLVAGQGDGLLQGWAILENASGQDWRDVAVTLIGGSPRALRQALFASHYVQRPEVPVDGEARKERQDFVAMAAAPPMEAGIGSPVAAGRRGAAGDRRGAGADRADAVSAAAAGDAAAGPDGDGADRRPDGADRARRPLPGGRGRPAPQRRLAAAQHHRRQPARRARHPLRGATRRRAHLPRRRALAAAGPGRARSCWPTAWTATSTWRCSRRAVGGSTGRGSRTGSWS